MALILFETLACCLEISFSERTANFQTVVIKVLLVKIPYLVFSFNIA